jgi:hypothetical protein
MIPSSIFKPQVMSVLVLHPVLAHAHGAKNVKISFLVSFTTTRISSLGSFTSFLKENPRTYHYGHRPTRDGE